MIAYDLHPSPHGAEPEPAMLDDGFSPPRASPTVALEPMAPLALDILERALAEQSDF
jgi:hypothetical protein